MGGVVVKNAATRAAGDDLLIGAEFFPSLGTEHNETCQAFLAPGFSHSKFPLPHHAVIVGQRAVTDGRSQLAAFFS